MVQVNADWTKRWLAKDFERELGIIFDGPGIYSSKTDTMLVVTDTKLTSRWNHVWPPEQRFDVYVYNVPFNQTIFSQIGIAPSRRAKSVVTGMEVE